MDLKDDTVDAVLTVDGIDAEGATDLPPIVELTEEPKAYPTNVLQSNQVENVSGIVQSDVNEPIIEYDIGHDPLIFPLKVEKQSSTLMSDTKQGSSSPDVLEVPHLEFSRKHVPERPTSTTSEETEHSTVSKRASFSREVSPFQETQMMEQNWKSNISKIDVVLSDVSALHKGHFNMQLFIQSFTNERTLRLLFNLFDWECRGFITQEKFIDCTRSTLLKHGGIELVELLDVLAYVVCGEFGDITEDHFIKILTSKGVIEKLFTYIVKDVDGCVSRQHIMDLIANLTYARPNTGFSKDKLEWLEELFRKALGHKQELSFEDFKKIVHSRNSFFAGRVFEIFDRDKSGSVSLTEFLDAMHQFAGKSPNDKIQFLFRVYDLDGDGLIQREELEQVMKACMEENGMKFSNEQIEDLTLALFEDADTEHRGEITFEALKAQLEKHPGLLENLSISIDRWLVPPQPHDRRANLLEKLKHLRPYQLTLPYLKNNYVYLTFLFAFLAVNLGLFIDRVYTIYNIDGSNIYYALARGGGQCLNFNCAFVLILMLRQSLTFLRSHGAAAFLPLDAHIYFHKMTGWVIFFFSCLHTVMHLINFPLYVIPHNLVLNGFDVNGGNHTAIEWLFTAKPKLLGLIPGWANPTGFILMAIILIMVICSLPFVRKSGYFEVFYWTHLLYVAFWILTLLHGPHFWKWFVVPAILFILEKVYRYCRVKTGHGKTYISSGILLPSKVIHLVIQKPSEFHYHPGDYVFVNIPEIAKYEWHPLTISSAPEQDEALWLHIRAVGEWTNRLYSYFEAQQNQCDRNYIKKISMINLKEARITVDPVVSLTMDAIDDDDVQEKNRKNGVVNTAYEHEPIKNSPKQPKPMTLLESHHEEESENQSENPDENKGIFRKKKVEKTTSAPDFDKRTRKREKNIIFRENFRNNSTNLINPDALKEAERIINGKMENDIMFSSNRSVAMSVRYMRHKPKVITLDMPEDCHSEEGSEGRLSANIAGTGHLESPKNTEVLRGSGALMRKTFSRFSGRYKQSVTRTPEQTLKLRQSRISRLKEAESFGQCTIGKPLVIYLDGPYGAPSSHIFRAQHAVLIGTGIGVTPFASILQSLMNRYLKARQSCPKCDHAWTADIPQTVMNLRKVDFFWINRDQRSFEWFVNLLSQLEIEQAQQGGALDRFLDMHMYITSALQRTDMKAVGLQLALELLHEKEKRDLITGLKTRTNAGRPNWDKVFKQLCSQKKGKITIFYCGPPELGRVLRIKSDEFGFDFRKEIF